MVVRRLVGEWAARLILLFLIAGSLVAILAGRPTAQTVEIHAVMPEKGGWLPGNLTAEAGTPLDLRLTSDDVVHGFAVGQQPWPAVDVLPGQVTKLSLTFEEPGTYTYYCTRWCGPNHWRMRGTIEVTATENGLESNEPIPQPLYVSLGLDIDAPHEVDVKLDRPPSAAQGKSLGHAMPAQFNAREAYLGQTPFAVWQELRADPAAAELSDSELWDLIAFTWRSQTTPESMRLGQQLYAENCAACHGENGDGTGVIDVAQAAENDAESFGSALLPPSDFTDARQMLGASTAVLQGKIIRGGMGTGMPYWGTIFTDEEIAALVDYLWTFQFPVDGS
jgi:mono/diheme cytochrome c family protein/plastocyanin